MIKSMTGFGREHIVANGREIIVEIRSVNHRYYEFTSRTPRAYGYLDEKLKGFLKSGISRGKVEASVSIYNQEGTDAEIELNKAVAKGYLDALRGAADELDLDECCRYMQEIEKMLPKDRFTRSHRSCIVSFLHIRNHDNKTIYFDNNERASISRRYLTDFKKAFQEYIVRYNTKD